MKRILLLVLALLTLASIGCQNPKTKPTFNLNFEKVSPNMPLPDDWFIWGNNNYSIKIDSITKHEGEYAVSIAPVGEYKAQTFGCVAYKIPANYEATTIELKAHIKMENVANGQIGLMLRIDGDHGVLAFDNLQQHDIKGTTDWKEYSVMLPYPKEAKTIYIGALLNGTGQIWVDDFQVLIDQKDIKDVEPIGEKIYKAALDKEFDSGSQINKIELDHRKIENLKVLGLVWGFLKYYHPTLAKGEYNWDYELFRYLPKILAVDSSKERDAILSQWIDKLGTVTDSIYTPKEEIKLNPDLNWIETSRLEQNLSDQLIKIKNAKRSNENYYIGLHPYVGNPNFKNENPYHTMKYPDAGFRLLTLYRYWNMIQYYFPYKNLIEESWQDVLAEFIPKLTNTSNEEEYKLTTLELIARIHDTHANIWGKDEALDKYWGINYAPQKVKFVEDKLLVTNLFDSEKAKDSNLQVGDIITSIEGKTVEEIVKERLKYTPASNYSTQLRDLAQRFLLRTNDSTLNIKYLHEGKENKESLKVYNNINIHKSFAPDTCFRMIKENIAYIYPGNIKNSYLPQIMEAAKNTKGLIIDLRCYPSDFIVFSLGEYLMPQKTDFVKFSIPSIESPGIFTLTPSLQVGKENDDYYKGKIVILINETTQSNAEYTTMALRAAPNVLVIGSTTAGADGNVSQIALPGNIPTLISGIGIYYPDGRETQRIGIVPDIELRPTIRGIREGRDDLLERAVEEIEKKR